MAGTASTKLRDRGVRKKRLRGKLNDRQQAFLAAYLVHLNATKAAIEAGYSIRTAGKRGSLLLKNPIIAQEIGFQRKQVQEQKGLERDEVLAKVAASLHRDLCDLVDKDGFVISDLRKLPKRAHAFIDGLAVLEIRGKNGKIESQKIKFKLSPSAAVQDMSMKHIGAYAADKQEVTVHFDWDSLYGKAKAPTNVVDGKLIEEKPG